MKYDLESLLSKTSASLGKPFTSNITSSSVVLKRNDWWFKMSKHKDYHEEEGFTQIYKRFSFSRIISQNNSSCDKTSLHKLN